MTTLCAMLILTWLPCLQPDIAELPAIVTWYDPARGGSNCDEGECGHFADGSRVTEDDYGRVAAGPPQLFYRWLRLPGIGVFHVRDQGGAVKIHFNWRYWRWAFFVDVLSHQAIECNYCLIEDWSIENEKEN